MTQYARLNTETLTVERILDITPEQYAALDDNPKQAYLRPFVFDQKPTPSATQVVVNAGYVVEPVQVRQTWALRDKTPAELDAEAREADRQTLVQLIAALTTSIQDHTNTPDVSGTAAVRLDKLEARTLATEQRITRLERIARHYLNGL
jgi:hypothetical protein